MTSVTEKDLWRTLQGGALRFINDERTGSVIVERTDDSHTLSLGVIRRIARQSRFAARDVVLMLDHQDQLAGSDRVERLIVSEPNRFDRVHALCFTSGFKHLRTAGTRHREIGRGFWEMSFTTDTAALRKADAIQELQLLQCWVGAERARQYTAVLAPPPSAVEQQVQLRDRLRNEVPLLPAEQWAALAGNRGKNPSAALGKYKSKGRLFAVTDGNRDLYPAFQFSDKDSKPKDAIAGVLKSVPESARGWPLLSWFNARNAFLNDQKPCDALDIEPDAVVDAAGQFYGRDD